MSFPAQRVVQSLGPNPSVDEILQALMQDGRLAVVGFTADGEPLYDQPKTGTIPKPIPLKIKRRQIRTP